MMTNISSSPTAVRDQAQAARLPVGIVGLVTALRPVYLNRRGSAVDPHPRGERGLVRVCKKRRIGAALRCFFPPRKAGRGDRHPLAGGKRAGGGGPPIRRAPPRRGCPPAAPRAVDGGIRSVRARTVAEPRTLCKL